RDRLKQTKEKLVNPLKIHRKFNLKKKDNLEMGDSEDRLTRKKGVLEVDGDEGTEDMDSDSSDAKSGKERSGIGKSSNPIRNLHINFKIEILEYTTTFHNQALVLGIVVDEYEEFMKYTGGLSGSIRRELKLFTVTNIEDATMKAIAIEGKHLKNDREDDKNKSGLPGVPEWPDPGWYMEWTGRCDLLPIHRLRDLPEMSPSYGAEELWHMTHGIQRLILAKSARDAQRLQEMTDENVTLRRHLDSVDDQLRMTYS
ncbi:hypothetical protein GIB67_016073, partial [Kingdonia uniflora]